MLRTYSRTLKFAQVKRRKAQDRGLISAAVPLTFWGQMTTTQGHTMTQPTRTASFSIFYYTESNHHHPLREAIAKDISVNNIDCDGDYRFLSVNDVIAHAIAERMIGKGSARCGVTEVQTDEGIYTREGSNGFARGTVSKWGFKTWAALEAADEDFED